MRFNIYAFPYHNNPMLQYAADKALKPTGRSILLSATPPAPLQRAVRRGALPHVKVPVRFHRHPLPVPERLPLKPLAKLLQAAALPKRLIASLQQSLDRVAQIFIFVPQIKAVEPLVSALRKAFPLHPIQGTSSHDAERADKVTAFRSKETRILVTTTILERGVTIPKSDVFVVDAGSALFDEAALVQMAGRAGRSKDDPCGRVVFASSDLTRSQAGAIRQIMRMNKLAGAKGFLLDKYLPRRKKPSTTPMNEP